jgi:ankyrin repeat protein
VSVTAHLGGLQKPRNKNSNIKKMTPFQAGFTPLHLASQEGHVDMTNLLLKNEADPNAKAKNGLAPIHLCAQEDRVNVAGEVLF